MVNRTFNQYKEKIFEFSNCLITSEASINPVDNKLINIDIGCGNGEFLVHIAKNNPEQFYYGFELQYKEVYRTAKKISKLNLKNCKVARLDARLIPSIFKNANINNIYIYFPDPWPKRKQKKNRLLHYEYLRDILGILNTDSSLLIKTDNDDYFCQIFSSIYKLKSEMNINIEEFTRDFHCSKYDPGHCITAFERIFLRDNMLINHIKCSLEYMIYD